MARLRHKGPSATLLARDDDSAALPIMPWGKTHNLTPTDAAPERNAEAVSATCGVISIIAIGGPAHFKQGDAAVVATADDPYLPEGVWHELPVFDGDAWSYVSIVAAPGTGSITAQICERQ